MKYIVFNHNMGISSMYGERESSLRQLAQGRQGTVSERLTNCEIKESVNFATHQLSLTNSTVIV